MRVLPVFKSGLANGRNQINRYVQMQSPGSFLFITGRDLKDCFNAEAVRIA